MNDDLERGLADAERWPGLNLDDGSGPAVPRSAAYNSALVDAALRRVATPRPWWRRKGSAPLIGAGVIALSTAAAAAAGLGPRLMAALSSPEAEQVASVTPQQSEAAKRAGATLQPSQTPSDTAPRDDTQNSAARHSNEGMNQALDSVATGAAAPPSEAAVAEGARQQTGQSAAGRAVNAAGSAPTLSGSGYSGSGSPGSGSPGSGASGSAMGPAGAKGSAVQSGARTADGAQNEQSATLTTPTPNEPEPRVAAERAAAVGPVGDGRTTPEDLLGRASALRKAHSYKEALAVYELILTRYPGTRQSSIARVAAAQIELSQLGDARAAQRRFQEAQGDAELGPEALFGLAEACRAQGDQAGERKALNRLLKQHPQSPLAAAARKRLASLATP